MRKFTSFLLVLLSGFIAMPVISAQNLITNGGFEDNTTGWQFTTSGTSAATSAIVQNSVHSGSNAMQISITQTGTARADIELKYSEIAVVKDAVYTLTFWAKTDANDMKATVVFKNAVGASTQFTDTSDIVITKDWKKYEAIFPSGIAGNVQISLQAGKSTGVINLDDFSFEKKSDSWYSGAELRIDKYRKGDFALKIQDGAGNPVSDSVIINLKKHEYPWGISIDLSDNSVGNTYSVTNAITATADAEIYQTERFSKDMAYNLPAEVSKKYKLTLKMAETYPNSASLRFFDILIDGKAAISNINVFNLAKANYKAFDTTIVVTAKDTLIKVEFVATGDNAAIKGIVLADSATGNVILRLNCGGATLTTSNGNLYVEDLPYVDKTLASATASIDDFRKATMLKHFNFGVTGNQFKWSGIEAEHGKLTYGPFDNTISWFKKVGWDFRGHTLLWGGTSSTDYHELPQWVGVLPGAQMHDTCMMRITRDMTRYKGIIKEYDVLNEPTHATYMQSKAGDSINWNCFKVARKADPNAKLFVNEYNLIEWQGDADRFTTFMQKILANGAPVTGIGAQCHIGNTTDIINFKARFDQLAQFGIPIKVTEFDMNAANVSQQVHATECAKFMRLCFSYPQIEGFIFWGLQDPGWADGVVNLYNEDKTPKIVSDTVYSLIHEKWATKLNGKTDADGIYRYRAFYGDYEVLVKFGTTWKKFIVSNKKGNDNILVVLNENNALATSPKIVKVQLNAPTGIELTFDKPMSDPSLDFKNFKVFDITTNAIKSAALKSGDPKIIVLTMNNAFKAKTYVPVSYAPGNITSTDGGVLEAFGPVLDETLVYSFMSASVNKSGKKIAIAFRHKITDATVTNTDFAVTVKGTAVTVTSSALGANKDTLYLTLSSPVTLASDAVVVTYTAGSLQTTDNKFVTGFSKTAKNEVVVPIYSSSRVLTYDHKKIQVIFTAQISASTIQASNFKVKVNNIDATISSAAISSSSDNAVEIVLANEIVGGNVVKIDYTPGVLASKDEVPVPAFSATVTNSLNDINNGENVISYFPNPMNEKLTIINVENYNNITITNLNGQVVANVKISGNKAEINTSYLTSGAYIVTLSGIHGKKDFTVMKK